MECSITFLHLHKNNLGQHCSSIAVNMPDNISHRDTHHLPTRMKLSAHQVKDSSNLLTRDPRGYFNKQGEMGRSFLEAAFYSYQRVLRRSRVEDMITGEEHLAHITNEVYREPETAERPSVVIPYCKPLFPCARRFCR